MVGPSIFQVPTLSTNRRVKILFFFLCIFLHSRRVTFKETPNISIRYWIENAKYFEHQNWLKKSNICGTSEYRYTPKYQCMLKKTVLTRCVLNQPAHFLNSINRFFNSSSWSSVQGPACLLTLKNNINKCCI